MQLLVPRRDLPREERVPLRERRREALLTRKLKDLSKLKRRKLLSKRLIRRKLQSIR